MEHVNIDIKSYTNIGEKINFHKSYCGKYYKKNDFHIIIYEDVDEETNNITKVMIKFNKNSLKITRSGYINHTQEFKEAKLSKSIYETPFGKMEMLHNTKKLSITEKIPGNISLIYDLDIKNLETGQIKLDFQISFLQ